MGSALLKTLPEKKNVLFSHPQLLTISPVRVYNTDSITARTTGAKDYSPTVSDRWFENAGLPSRLPALDEDSV
jgi:hypothetical protein